MLSTFEQRYSFFLKNQHWTYLRKITRKSILCSINDVYVGRSSPCKVLRINT